MKGETPVIKKKKSYTWRITLLFLNHYSSVLWAICSHCKCRNIKNTSTAWNFYMKAFFLMVTFLFWILQNQYPIKAVTSYVTKLQIVIFTSAYYKRPQTTKVFDWITISDPCSLFYMSVLTLHFTHRLL